MATREENLKKINDELKKLSDEELDEVAGGTTNEWGELARYFHKRYHSNAPRNSWKHTWRHLTTGEIERYLDRDGIEAKVYKNNWYNLFGIGADKNVYKDKNTGESLTHEEVMARLKG